MKLFEVYNRFDVEIISGQGCHLVDSKGKKYLDMYGGHAVISIGHSHPLFVQTLKEQIEKMIFYSNAVKIPLQQRLAEKLGMISGCSNYEVFLCNSGAEANENAIKLASFFKGRSKVLAVKNAFHGRTSAAVNCTDNEKIKAAINKTFTCDFIDMNDIEAVRQALQTKEYAAVIIEPIQGIGGLDEASDEFLQCIAKQCSETETIFIADEIQSGMGRTGEFFAFQKSKVQPDIITMAKGLGNGFPIGAVLINPKKIKASKGMLGSTFGGNHLACQAALTVLEVIGNDQLIKHVQKMSELLLTVLKKLDGVRNVKGRGLMLGLEFDFPIKKLRLKLIEEFGIFTGSSSNPNQLRILPPLNISEQEINLFVEKLKIASAQPVLI